MNNDKELIEKITSSKYFETLVDEQIMNRVGQLYQRNKWIIRALILVVGIISFILGYKFYDFNSQIEKYQAKFDMFQAEANEIMQMKESFNSQLNLLEKQGVKEDVLISRRESMNSGYESLLKERINESKQYYEEIKKMINENESLKSSMEKTIKKSNEINEQLTSLFQTKIRSSLDSLDRRTKLIEITSSIRYLYAERSDRTSQGNEYRPGAIKLPYSDDVIKAVFHEVLSTEDPKEILVDFYLNDDKKAINQSVFTEAGGFYEQNAIQFASSEKNIYEATPVFIYLPPNVPFVKRIPDFVVLKISLLKRNSNN